MIKSHSMQHIDFEHWAELAQQDPEYFELLRTRTIDAFIQRCPEEFQHRLRCLQWRVDQVRKRAGTPMAACIKISEMMWDSFNQMNRVSRDLCTFVNEGEYVSRPNAAVLPFQLRP